MLFGEGVSIIELTALVRAIREKDLVLQVKILDGTWEEFSAFKIQEMIRAIAGGSIKDSSDIRLRLFAKGAEAPKVSVPPHA